MPAPTIPATRAAPLLGMAPSATQLLSSRWELRAGVTVYDAAYVALAETLDCELLTADGALSRR